MMNSTLYLIIFLLIFIWRQVMEVAIQPRPSDLNETGELAGKISLRLFIVAYLISAGAVIYFLYLKPAVIWLFGSGIVLFIAGFWGRKRALATLGDNYSQLIQIHPHHQLVVRGPYAFIRHPLYAFYQVEMTALLFIQANWISWIAWVIVLLAILYRIRQEEALLAATFGDAFQTYCQTTYKLIPWIY